LETDERLPDDALNRRMYELRDPEELEIFVANIAPTYHNDFPITSRHFDSKKQ